MINFEKLRYKNFLSAGNQFTEYDFQKSNATLIVGENGAGKSTLLDALTFVLFNKSFRKINKSQLINSINEKDCLVEVEFTINNVRYLVRRGIKPNIFEFYYDGVKFKNLADDRDTQNVLEQKILKVNYKSFTQIVILGSSTFVPFMQLTPANRREVIEDLLDIRVFSSMNQLVKDKTKDLKNEVDKYDIKRYNAELAVLSQKKIIEKFNTMNTDKVSDLKLKIDKLSDQNNKRLETIKILQDQVKDFTEQQVTLNFSEKKLKKLTTFEYKMLQKIENLQSNIKFFESNSVCPTCTQTIEDQFRIDILDDSQTKMEELQSAIRMVKDSIEEENCRESNFINLSREILKLNDQISKENVSISSNQRFIRDLEQEIQALTTTSKDGTDEQQDLRIFEQSLQKIEETLKLKKEKLLYYEFVHSLLKDDGIKTKIIKKYIPYINQKVNEYLRMMDFYINFHLDEEFNETIKSPIHEIYCYNSFSEGEKTKINLALVFAWRDVAKLKNSINTNLIIFDEIFDSSLDSFGTEDFMRIIKYVIQNANIFVISHKSELNDKFDNVIKFNKVKGFSIQSK